MMERNEEKQLCPLSFAATESKQCDSACRLYTEDGECLLALALAETAGLASEKDDGIPWL